MKKLIILFLAFILGTFYHMDAQVKPIVSKATHFDKTPPLREMKMIIPGVRDRSWKDGVIHNEGFDFPGVPPEEADTGPDPVWQDHFGEQKSEGPFLSFDGTDNVNGVLPPDTDGDVGPNHYFQIINLSFQIFDKEGNSLYGPADNSTLWDGFIGPWTGHNDGDPIVAYDELADRWVVSQFALECAGDTWWELVAVSTSPDPLGSYYRYAFEYPVFNDYPKLSVWPDAYYCSFNLLDEYNRVGASAYEREAMLIGDTNARHILFDMPPEDLTWSMMPADFDGDPPPAGSPCYWIMGTDDDNGIHSADQIQIWEFDVDWDQPSNSTFERVKNIDVEPFNYRLCDAGNLQNCIPQPDGAPLLDALSAFLMQPLQYRNFGTYETMVLNHTINVDGNGLAGIRWYELRKEDETEGWYIYQQGTYAPDEHHRWMGSIAMDARGYIALGYTVSSETIYPSLRYTGRPPDAPLGQMTFTEEEIIKGTGCETSSYHRWGDYSMMAVDPVNDTTFWYTGEYVKNSGNANWRTRIGAFNLIVDLTSPADVTDLTAHQTTTNAIKLNWTATGNDGVSGTADFYDIRYSLEPITSTNWENALKVENDIEPAESGTVETFMVKGLEYSTEYYFALKVADRQLNYSGMSNVAVATVNAAPEVTINENDIGLKIFEPCKIEYSWVAGNNGGSDLKYQVYKDIAHKPGSFGNRLGVAREAAMLNRGMLWHEGYLYMLDWFGGKMYKYDTLLQQKLDTFNVHDSPYGLCWDGNYFWIGSSNGLFIAYNADGTTAGLSFQAPFYSTSAHTFNGEYFVVCEINTASPQIYFLDANGREQKVLKSNISDGIRQLCWVDPHQYKQQLYYVDKDGDIGQLIMTGDSALVVREADAPDGYSYGLTHDGYNLWIGGGTLGEIYRVDDGMDELAWFNVSPITGIVSMQSEDSIDLTIDLGSIAATDTAVGFRLVLNDPLTEELAVPVTINPADLNLGQDTSFCNHQSALLTAGDGFNEYLWSNGSGSNTLLVDSNSFALGENIIWAEVSDDCGGTFRDTIIVTLEDCTGIEDLINSLKVLVVPNPNQGVFDVIIEGDFPGLLLNITNLSGYNIYNYMLEGNPAGKSNHRIDLSEQARGVYLLKIIYGKSISTKKILIE